jgi:hypothetical protein
MINLKSVFKRKPTKDIPIENNPEETVESLPPTITFESYRANPEIQIMVRYRKNDPLEPLKVIESFSGFKAQTIGDVDSIYTGMEITDITVNNVTEFIEEPCIPAFLFLQDLGIQTYWSDANKYRSFASIEIKTNTLSEENKNIALNNNISMKYNIDLSFPITRGDTVQEVSDKLLAMCKIFVPQPVLYGHKNQAEALNEMSNYNYSYISEISNINSNYSNDHFNYLLKTYPQYITFNGEEYKCLDMPDDLFQKEVLNMDLMLRIFNAKPHVCINGVVWDSRELYDINERNTKLNKVDPDINESEAKQEYPENHSEEPSNKIR